ncbi:MAG TPA: hypothetical protein VFD84_15785, partial [Candidatus Binatia bacterium]|nr:hypothetical protein [Candidatus Binatia bacterium]
TTSVTRYSRIESNLTSLGSSSAAAGNTSGPLAGDVHLFAMSCGVTVAPGLGSSTAFQIGTCSTSGCAARTETAATCAIGDTGTTCSYFDNTGVAITAANGWLQMKVVATGTPAAADGACTIYYTIDGF